MNTYDPFPFDEPSIDPSNIKLKAALDGGTVSAADRVLIKMCLDNLQNSRIVTDPFAGQCANHSTIMLNRPATMSMVLCARRMETITAKTCCGNTTWMILIHTQSSRNVVGPERAQSVPDAGIRNEPYGDSRLKTSMGITSSITPRTLSIWHF
jgi:hypothetical protein